LEPEVVVLRRVFEEARRVFEHLLVPGGGVVPVVVLGLGGGLRRGLRSFLGRGIEVRARLFDRRVERRFLRRRLGRTRILLRRRLLRGRPLVGAAQHFFGGVLLVGALALEVEDRALRAYALLVLRHRPLAPGRRVERPLELIGEALFVEEVVFGGFFLGKRVGCDLAVGTA